MNISHVMHNNTKATIFFPFFPFFFFFFHTYNKKYYFLQMGNANSKKKDRDRPSIVRSESSSQQPDNELSNATATSVNSILVISSLQRGAKNGTSAPTNIITAQNTFKNTTVGGGGGSMSPPYSPESNQLTFTSANQLTATSIRSIGWNLDIDECINRLLDIGVKNKVPKSICFRNSEIVAICRAAQEVFLSQPVSVFFFFFFFFFFAFHPIIVTNQIHKQKTEFNRIKSTSENIG
jgi:hypothetical protein